MILSRELVPGKFWVSGTAVAASAPTGMPKSPQMRAAAASGVASVNLYQPRLPTRNRPRSRAETSTTTDWLLVVHWSSAPKKRGLPSVCKVSHAPSSRAGGSTLPSRGITRAADSSRAVCRMSPCQVTDWTSWVISLVEPPPGAVKSKV